MIGTPLAFICRDRVGIQTGHWRTKASAENRIEQQIAAEHLSSALAQFFRIQSDDWFDLHASKHLGGIAAQLRRISQQQHANLLPGLTQLARSYESIAAVVTFAAHHTDLLRLRIMLQREISYRRSGMLHQVE